MSATNRTAGTAGSMAAKIISVIFPFLFAATAATAPDSLTVQSLIDSSLASYRSDIELSLSTGLQALEVAEEIGYRQGIADALDNLGVIYSRKGNDRKALSALKRSLDTNRTLENHAGIASNLLNIGGIYKQMSQYERALNYFHESLRVCEDIDLQTGVAANLSNIGLVYHEMEQYQRALEYFFRAEEINREIGNSYNLSVTFNNIGLTYSDLGRLEESLNWHRKSLDLKEKDGNLIGMAYSLNNIGKTRYLMEEHEAALAALKRALELNDGQDPDLASISHEHLARIFLDAGDFETAARHAYKTLELSLDFGSMLGEQEAYRLLSEIYSQKGDFETAFSYHRKLLDLRDSIFNDRMAERIEKLRNRYEAEQREARISLLEQERYLNRQVRNAFAVGAILLFIIAFLVYNRQKIRIRKNLVELENRRLKERQLEQELAFKKRQLTSHSLHLVQKNTMMQELRNSIRQLRSGNGEKAGNALQNLDNLIDYSFYLDEDWAEFQRYFEEVHTGFFDGLKACHPTLTPKELRLCALLKLNMSSKEIASLLGISPSSVKIARYRLRKKLHLETEESLTDYLMNLESVSTPDV